MRIAVHDYPGHPFQMQLSRALAARGHVVKHLYFAGDPGPKGAFARRPGDPINLSVEPIRLRFPYQRESLPRRYIGDLLYGRAVGKSVQEFEPDIIISGNAPLHAQASLQRAASAVGASFVFWVQDLHGLAMNRLLARRWFGLGGLIADYYTSWENRLIRSSDRIVIISPDFRNWLPVEARRDGVTEVIMNWGPLQEIDCRPKVNDWSVREGLVDKFVFMYTGTLGRKHNHRLLWDLSEFFLNDPDVVIVVAASGASANELAALQGSSARKNIRLMPPQPMEAFPDVLGSADVLLTFLENDAAEFSVPSKVLSYLCAGRSILMSAPKQNVASRIVAESAAGVVVDASSTQAFLDAAVRLRHDHADRVAHGQAARRYAERHFDIKQIAGQFETMFARCLRPVAYRQAGMRGRATSPDPAVNLMP